MTTDETDFQTSLICSNCFKSSDDKIELKRCSSCHLVFYCSLECQKENWKIHKKTCQLISNKIKEQKNLKNFKNETILLKIQRPEEKEFDQLLCYNEAKSFKEFLESSFEQYTEIEKLIKEKGEDGLVLYFQCKIGENGKVERVDLTNYSKSW